MSCYPLTYMSLLEYIDASPDHKTMIKAAFSKKDEVIKELSSAFKFNYSEDKVLVYTKGYKEFPVLYKKGVLIKDYCTSHLLNSCIKNIIELKDVDEDRRALPTTFILYYYWFFKQDNLKDIITNVIVDLETMISMLMNKAATTYKHIDVAPLITILQYRLKIENLLKEGSLIKNLNMRRK